MTSPTARSFALPPAIAGVTNIELDHHATYASEVELRDAFEAWLATVPETVRSLGAAAASTSSSRCPGEHNRLNAAVALAALELAGVARDDGGACARALHGRGASLRAASASQAA